MIRGKYRFCPCNLGSNLSQLDLKYPKKPENGWKTAQMPKDATPLRGCRNAIRTARDADFDAGLRRLAQATLRLYHARHLIISAPFRRMVAATGGI